MKTVALIALTLVSASAFAGAKKIAPKNTGTVACEEVLGPNAPSDLMNSCLAGFEGFQSKMKMLALAELSKTKVAADVSLQDLMKQTGAVVIAEADKAGALVTQGATVPDLAFDWGVGSVDEDGGAYCEPAYDFSQDDEFGKIIPGLYDCKIRGGVWINYSVKNMCQEFPTLKLEEREQWIEFQMTEKGIIDRSTVKTSPLLMIIDNCAG